MNTEQQATEVNEAPVPQSVPEVKEAEVQGTSKDDVIQADNSPEEGQQVESAAEEAKPKDTKPWFLRRIDELAKQKNELAKENQQLKQAVVTSEQPQDQANLELTPAQIQDLTEKRARQLLIEKEFTDKCNAVYNQGKSSIEGFDDAVRNLNTMDADKVAALYSVVVEMDDAPQLIAKLGHDPEAAEALLRMPLPKMAIEMAKMSQSLKPKTHISKAPAPVTPVISTSGTGATDPEKMDMDQWMQWREKQKAERKR